MPAPKRICATCGKRAKYLGRIWIDGESKYLGYFCTHAHRKAAQEAGKAANATRVTHLERPLGERITCDEWADRWLAKVEREQKASSLGTARDSLTAFRDNFGARPIGSITHIDAEDWANSVPVGRVKTAVSLFNYAVRQRVVDYNPFAGLGKRGRGRQDTDPPTVKELERLLDACDALGDYGPQMRALVIFASLTGMRPGELYELRWADIDLAANRICVSRRLYRGAVDTPKSNRAKTIALPPPARDVLMRQPTRGEELVFLSKTGKRLQASTVCQYWALVKASAGLDFDFYLATKHYGVHLLYKLGVSKRAIAAQMGWSEDAVDGLLRTYGHIDLIALSEIDALYAMHEPTHQAANPAS